MEASLNVTRLAPGLLRFVQLEEKIIRHFFFVALILVPNLVWAGLDSLCRIRAGMAGKPQKPHDLQVGVFNSTESLLNLRNVNGIPVETLQEKLRANEFIGPKEDLRELLARDNETVKKLGLTHQDLAKPLLIIEHEASLRMDRSLRKVKLDDFLVTINGMKFSVGIVVSRWDSPLGESSFYIAYVTNENTGEKIRYPGLLATHIEYGFYGGKEIPQKAGGGFQPLLDWMIEEEAPQGRLEALRTEMGAYVNDSDRVDPGLLAHFFNVHHPIRLLKRINQHP